MALGILSRAEITFGVVPSGTILTFSAIPDAPSVLLFLWSNFTGSDIIGNAAAQDMLSVLQGNSTITGYYNLTVNDDVLIIEAKSVGSRFNLGNASIIGSGITYQKFDYQASLPVASIISFTHVNCYGGSNGSATANSIDGFPPYTYSWGKQGEPSFSRTSKTISGIKSGYYTVTVTDSQGQTSQVSIQITQPTQIEILIELDDTDVYTTVSGGTPPYTYSWNDGPVTTKDRTSLDPGEYTLTVTDAHGCQRLSTVIIGISKFFFSRNPVVLPLQAANPEAKPNLSFVVEVHLEDDYDSGTFNKILEEKLEQPADVNGETIFDVQSILDGSPSLQMHKPALDLEDVVPATGMFKRYFLKHTEKYGTPPAEQSLTQLSTNFIVNGGLSYEEYAENNFFTSYYPNKRPFFSWQPSEKHVFTDQPEFLYYMIPFDGTTEIRMRALIKFKDGSEAVNEVLSQTTGLKKFQVYCFPAGFDQLKIQNYGPGKDVLYYELWVVDQNMEVISERKRFVVEHGYFPYRRYFLYLNSLGGTDTIACTARAKDSFRTKEEVAEKILPHDYSVDSGELVVVNKSGESNVSLSSGYKSREYVERSKDFVLSREVYLVDRGRLLPVTIKSRFQQGEGENLHLIKFSYTPPKVSSYSPFLGDVIEQVIPDFALAAGSTLPVIEQGNQNSIDIVLTRLNGFDEDVDLSIVGLPANVTGQFIPSTIQASNMSSMLINVGGTATPGTYNLIIKGVSISYPNGRFLNVTLNVTLSPDITPPAFLTGPTAENVDTDGFDLSLEVNEVSTIFYGIVADSTAAPTSADVVAGSGFVKNGNYQQNPGAVELHGISGLSGGTDYDVYVVARDIYGNLQFSPVQLDVSTDAIPDFELSTAEDTLIIEKGANDNTDITINRLNGFGEDVYFSVESLPAGVTPLFTNNPEVGAGSNLQLNVSAAATSAGSVIILKAISVSYPGGKTVQINLTVIESTSAGFPYTLPATLS